MRLQSIIVQQGKSNQIKSNIKIIVTCYVSCHLTNYDFNINKLADVVIFHAPTREGILPNKTKNSLFVLFSMEQPLYAPILTDFKALAHFDVLITYSLRSTFPGTTIPNIPVTYFPLNIVSPNVLSHPPRPFDEKNGYETGDSMYFLCFEKKELMFKMKLRCFGCVIYF